MTIDRDALRRLCEPVVPTCGDDCEHIECDYVVDCERRMAQRSDAVPELLDECERLEAAQPKCLGVWLKGSGGHRLYDFECDKRGRWNVGVGFVCDEHKTAVQSELNLLYELFGVDKEAWAERALLYKAERDKAESDLSHTRKALEEVRAEVERWQRAAKSLGRVRQPDDLHSVAAGLSDLRAEVDRMKPVVDALDQHERQYQTASTLAKAIRAYRAAIDAAEAGRGK